MLGPALYDKYPSGAIPKPDTKPGKDAIVSDGIGYSGYKHQKGEKVIAITDNNGSV
jgi:hypothetical protein